MSFLKANKEISPPVAQAFQLLKEEKFKEASKFINFALQSQPKSVILHLLNSLTYEKLAERGDAGGLELAAVGYQNVINLDGSNAFAITQLGKIKYRENKFAEAQENFANALLVKPDDVNLLQELAAASYYAHDVKTALVAIDKAVKLKPNDPLINRSAAMIHAALGNFTTAQKHIDLFQKQAGKDPAIEQLASRYNDWVTLYKSGRLSLAAAKEPTPPPTPTTGAAATTEPPLPAANVDVTPPPTESTPKESLSGKNDGGGDTAPSEGDAGAPAAPQEVAQTDLQSPYGPQIVIDVYLLQLSEDVRTSKGNNIMDNLAVTLTPGGFASFRGRMGGTGVSNAGTNGDTTVVNPSTGFRATEGGSNQFTTADITGGAAPVFTPATQAINFNQAGSVFGNVYSGGITWAGLTYSLNIANAVDIRSQIVSRPTLMTYLNKQTTLFTGDQIVQGITGQYGGNLLKYNLGLTTVITPTKIEGDEVSFDVNIEGLVPTSDLNQLSQGLTVRIAQITTHAKMKFGETLTIGGVYTNSDFYTKEGFPGLQDLPLVQYFFANENTRSLRRSALIMITPRSPELLKSAVSRALARGKNRPNLDELSNRHPDWFSAHPNLDPIIHQFSKDPATYYEFRTGDILPPSWGWEEPLQQKLDSLAGFMYF